MSSVVKPRYEHQKLYGFQCPHCQTMHVLSHMFWNTFECYKCGKNISNPKKEYLNALRRRVDGAEDGK